MFNFLKEGVEKGDLEHLIHPELHIDEYKSKLGKDQDVCVVSFKVTGKGPASDLVSFIEKGYEWVLDADLSSGEMDDGDYIVFVEVERGTDLPKQIMNMMNDLMNVTNQKTEDWRVRYYKSISDHELTLESLQDLVIDSPEEYESKYGGDTEREEDDNESDSELDDLRTAAGVEVTTKAPKNEFTESLRNLAGISRQYCCNIQNLQNS